MLHPKGTINLIDAIVMQAVKDYRAKQGNDIDSSRFFQSRWFSFLTDVDGEVIKERLDREIEASKAENKDFNVREELTTYA